MTNIASSHFYRANDLALSIRMRGLDKFHRRSFFNAFAQQANIPIGELNAPMRFGFADLGWVGRAMDAIPFRREPNPV